MKVLVIAVLAFLSCAYILPMYVLIATSLKSLPEINAGTYLQPSGNPQFENYVAAWTTVSPSLVNSTIIAFTATALCMFIGGLGGYYLSRSRAFSTKVLFVLVGIALYLPYQVILIPLVQIMAITRLALTHWGLILSYLVLNVPLASVLLGTFFLSVPRELEEAAAIDGASKFNIFFRVVTPISFPAYASVGIIIFTQIWNEFLLALTLATPETTTVQVELNNIKGSLVAVYNIQMAAALITVLVPLVFFLFLGRYFVRGILAGALKG